MLYLSSKEWAAFNFMAAVTIHSDFEAQENEVCHGFHFFPSSLLWSDRTRCHDFHFLNAEFQASFFTLLFHPHQEAHQGSSSFSTIKAVSYAYLRLLIFLPAIMIPAYDSSSWAFCMMYSAYKLNKLGDNIQPWGTPSPIWNQSVVPYPVASWPAYKFLRRQVRWSGISTSLRTFQFVVIHRIRSLGIVNEVEVDVFLEFPCFFYDPADAGNLISYYSAFSKSNLYIWKFSVHILLKSGLENLEHCFARVWDECNCA